MKTLNRIFNLVITKITKISKPQKKFLAELFEVIFSAYGKGNFLNLADIVNLMNALLDVTLTNFSIGYLLILNLFLYITVK